MCMRTSKYSFFCQSESSCHKWSTGSFLDWLTSTGSVVHISLNDSFGLRKMGLESQSMLGFWDYSFYHVRTFFSFNCRKADIEAQLYHLKSGNVNNRQLKSVGVFRRPKDSTLDVTCCTFSYVSWQELVGDVLVKRTKILRPASFTVWWRISSERSIDSGTVSYFGLNSVVSIFLGFNPFT